MSFAFLDMTGGFIVLGIAAFFYFLPALIANIRNHSNFSGVLLVNLLTGWTGIGWIAALVMAVSGPPGQKMVYCSACQQSIPFGTADCPKCGAHFTNMPTPTEKVCPFCAETIKAEAKVCRYCQRDLVTLNPKS